MRTKGDISRSTFAQLVMFFAQGSTDPTIIGQAFQDMNALCDQVAEGDEASEEMLNNLRAKMEESCKVPRKLGRKPLVNEAAIAQETLAKFTIQGALMTPGRLALMPEGDSLRVALERQIAEAIKIAKAQARAAKANAEIAELSANFARHEIDTLPG